MVSDFRFEDGAQVARVALPAARRIRALRSRAAAGGTSSIFVNDNLGQWRSDFRQLIERCGQSNCAGAPILGELAPGAEDYYVLKPTHAGFFGTPLEHLLKGLRARTLILTGISAHQCILFTANEAYLRNYRLIIPRDCIAAKTPRWRRLALEYFQTVLHADTSPAARITFSKKGRPRGSSQRSGSARTQQ
ncbi:MAG: cysteine hydrolase [Sinobacteraceae bacterium]|nr:cysteine hydrolase [Nevskiaceae bacterium]